MNIDVKLTVDLRKWAYTVIVYADNSRREFTYKIPTREERDQFADGSKKVYINYSEVVDIEIPAELFECLESIIQDTQEAQLINEYISYCSDRDLMIPEVITEDILSIIPYLLLDQLNTYSVKQ